VKLEEFFKLTNATSFGLCDADFGVKLAELGADLVRRVSSVLYLSRPAQPHTIKVTFGSQIFPITRIKVGFLTQVETRSFLVRKSNSFQSPVAPKFEVDFIAAQY
jgi:hypothetical protein